MPRRIILNPALIEDDREFDAWLDHSLSQGMPMGRALQLLAERDARKPAQPAASPAPAH